MLNFSVGKIQKNVCVKILAHLTALSKQNNAPEIQARKTSLRPLQWVRDAGLRGLNSTETKGGTVLRVGLQEYQIICFS